MQRPTVVNVRKQGKQMDVYVGRPSAWGNPFVIGADGSREEVVAKYREWIAGQPKLLRKLPALAGKRLGCFCAPLPCHADVLADLVEALEEVCHA